MTSQEAAYLAGFFDGEGCVGAYITNRPASPTNRAARGMRLSVSVAQVDRRPLLMLQEAFGGAVVVSDKGNTRKDGFNRRICYVWIVSGPSAQTALRAMLPYLVVKREQAEEALKIVMIPRGARRRTEYRDEDVRIASHIKELKRKAG